MPRKKFGQKRCSFIRVKPGRTKAYWVKGVASPEWSDGQYLGNTRMRLKQELRKYIEEVA